MIFETFLLKRFILPIHSGHQGGISLKMAESAKTLWKTSKIQCGIPPEIRTPAKSTNYHTHLCAHLFPLQF